MTPAKTWLLLWPQGQGAPEARIPGKLLPLFRVPWQFQPRRRAVEQRVAGLEPCRERQLRAGSWSVSPVLISFAGGAPQTRR